MPQQPVIIKRMDEEEHDAHHGGAWKVAYADFMTAMMAFFLLLWILAASDEEKLRGLADYFTPSLSEAGGRGQGLFDGQVLAATGVLSGTDGPQSAERLPSFGQENPLAVFDSRLRDEAEFTHTQDGENAEGGAISTEGREAFPGGSAEPSDAAPSDASDPPATSTAAQMARDEEIRRERLRELEAQIVAAVASDPELAGLQRHLRFELSPEGLEVQMVDSEGRSMFDLGSAELRGRAQELIAVVGRAIAPVDKPVAVSGHTDSIPFGNGAAYTNWELSTDRAHATRRELIAQGVAASRFQRITGLADTVPLDADREDGPQNRRIGVLLVYPTSVLAD
ncbi:flagellar motor protein MotB [Roseibacterium sp. SDUM158017]|uniref:flagellar motor protein MotB n=1 Tax=Roseicyclus salinarum TaxID=3036773 RepID=UPI0024152291|nr:flagellar motor protein MotB [Roseibacterium sp. SDUM158017]MDG4648660.1 flagellar motor protein MotB [Roseibacterium sp. SDUM158017]